MRLSGSGGDSNQERTHVARRQASYRGYGSNDPNGNVIDTMNTLSEQELNAMDKVGKSLMDANVPPGKAITAVH